MNPEQWLSLKWNGGSTMSDRWLNQSKIIQIKEKHYDQKLEEEGYETILNYGIACYKKRCKVLLQEKK